MVLATAPLIAHASSDWDTSVRFPYTAPMDLIVLRNGNILVASVYLWETYRTIRLQQYTRSFEPIGEPIEAATRRFAIAPLVAEDRDGNFHVIWSDRREGLSDYAAWYKLVSPTGEPLSEEILLRQFQYTSNWYAAIQSVEVGDEAWVNVLLADSTSPVTFYQIDLAGQILAQRPLDKVSERFRVLHPKILPRDDGSANVLYAELAGYEPDGAAILYIVHMIVDRDGTILCPRHEVAKEGSFCSLLEGAVADRAGNIHLAMGCTGGPAPADEFRDHVVYAMLDSNGDTLVPPWIVSDEPTWNNYASIHIAIDGQDRPVLLTTYLTGEDSPTGIGYLAPWFNPILRTYVLDPQRREVLNVGEVLTDPRSMTPIVFRSDRGEIFGAMWNGGNPYEGVLLRTRPEFTCRDSGVDAKRAFDERTLFVNGDAGDVLRHVTRVGAGTPLALSLASPLEAPSLRFYIQARLGEPAPGEPRFVPGIGMVCADLLDHASADAIWNGLGRMYGKLGSSRVRHHAIPDPPSAPGVFFRIPGRATQSLPPGTRFTLEGFQSDPTASKGFALTNAVIVEIQ